jgi:hypothetical protein
MYYISIQHIQQYLHFSSEVEGHRARVVFVRPSHENVCPVKYGKMRLRNTMMFSVLLYDPISIV